jgi:hypothetical protein
MPFVTGAEFGITGLLLWMSAEGAFHTAPGDASNLL